MLVISLLIEYVRQQRFDDIPFKGFVSPRWIDLLLCPSNPDVVTSRSAPFPGFVTQDSGSNAGSLSPQGGPGLPMESVQANAGMFEAPLGGFRLHNSFEDFDHNRAKNAALAGPFRRP